MNARALQRGAAAATTRRAAPRPHRPGRALVPGGSGRCACGGSCPRCAASTPAALPVVAATDVSEREADRVAQAALDAPGGGRHAPSAPPSRSPSGGRRAPAPVRDVLASPGEPLADAGARELARHLGGDAARIRLHRDAVAAQSARAIGARAYAAGEHLVFAAGQYAPQTPGGRRLLAHELAHTVQQRGAAPVVQRAMGDQHDLTAPDLSGDIELEECFDGTRVLRRGRDHGPAVAKLQQALLDLGFALPVIGADGDFGAETETAVREFQTAAGLTAADVDGRVGDRTIGLLDRALRRGTVDADADAAADDFRIRGKFEDAAKEPRTIFFDFASDVIDVDEQTKLTALAADPTLTQVTLIGMASEEGDAGFNLDLATRRAAAVADIVGGMGIGVTSRPDLRFGAGDLQYRRRRAVRIEAGTVPPGPVDSCASLSPVQPCPAPFPEFTDAVTAAGTMVQDALDVLPSTDADVITLFDTLFRTDSTTRAATVTQVISILGMLQTHIAAMPTPGAHRCANECDGICKLTVAYNTKPQPSGPLPPAGVTTLCVPTVAARAAGAKGFADEDAEKRAIILVHEGHHGIPGIASADPAYSDERIMRHIDTATALRNATSFHLFVKFAQNPTALHIGPEKPDTLIGITDPAEQFAVDRALAWLQSWIGKANFHSSSAYADVRDSRKAGHFVESAEEYMDRIAPRFGLTPPPALPTAADQAALAAIHDRIHILSELVDKPITVEKVSAGPDEWQPGPGTHLTLSAAFFALPPSRQLVVLLQEIVRATPAISARFEAEYIELIDQMRQRSRIAGPTP